MTMLEAMQIDIKSILNYLLITIFISMFQKEQYQKNADCDDQSAFAADPVTPAHGRVAKTVVKPLVACLENVPSSSGTHGLILHDNAFSVLKN